MAEKFLIKKTKIRVIGIGGGGGAITRELAKGMKNVSFLIANTDSQALKKAPKNVSTFHFGQGITGGLGTGMDVKLGEMAAEKEEQRIKRVLRDKDFCIFVVSLGGGTGSGSSPIFIEAAKEFKGITLGIFTMPFKFEGERRMKIARHALERVKPHLNGVLVIQNQKIFKIIDKKTSLSKAFQSLNKILAEDLRSLIELIYKPGLINIDFADFKTILQGKGDRIYFSTAEAKGPDRADEVIKKVLNSPIMDFSNKSGKRILFNISGPPNLKMTEVEKICAAFSDLSKNSKIVFGISKNPPQQKSQIKVTLLVVKDEKKKKIAKESPPPVPEEKPKEEEPKQEIKKKEPIKPKKTVKPKKKPKKKTKKKEKRLSALEVKKAMQDAENKRWAEDEKWDVPAFMRRSPWREKVKKTKKKT